MTAAGAGPPHHRFHDWEAVQAGIVAGITAVAEGAGAGSESDFGLVTGGRPGVVAGRYEALAESLGMRSVVVARQVHGIRVVSADASRAGGARVVGEADGLVTADRGVLLAVTAADCVPVFVADVAGRCIALLHAGWRGAAAGMLEAGLSTLHRRFGVGGDDVSVYLGPAICGSCYEVGPEVQRAFGRGERRRAHMDLRAELARRALRAGVTSQRVSQSGWCTRCGPVRLHSHRAGGAAAGRMAAFLGLAPEPAGPQGG